jgi:hypothetical protein
MGRACRPNGTKRNAYRVLVGNAEGKEPLGRPRPGREDDIKIGFREIRWGEMYWIHLA